MKEKVKAACRLEKRRDGDMLRYDVEARKAEIDRCIAAGPYSDTWESLSKHETPVWFRDAKFGIFIHFFRWEPREAGGFFSPPAWKLCAPGRFVPAGNSSSYLADLPFAFSTGYFASFCAIFIFKISSASRASLSSKFWQ